MELEQYFQSTAPLINAILARPAKEDVTFDILDDNASLDLKRTVLKEKQRQMKTGDIWQTAIGSVPGYQDLGVGHETGLDVISHLSGVAIELKNRTNTDNASAKKSNLDKLAKFKKQNPNYICIYANINDTTEDKTLSGFNKTIIHDGVEIRHMAGMEFLKFIYGDQNTVLQVVNFLKTTIGNHAATF